MEGVDRNSDKQLALYLTASRLLVQPLFSPRGLNSLCMWHAHCLGGVGQGVESIIDTACALIAYKSA